MLGDVVGGYVVKEALGSGQRGLLFLALHVDTGHRAVVQRRLGEDDVRLFAREAAQLLGLTDTLVVERRLSRAGVEVLLAVVDGDAPGTGHTLHTNTARLPDLPARPVPAARRLPVAALVLLVVVGAVLGALLMSSAERPAALAPPLAAVAPVAEVKPPPMVLPEAPIASASPQPPSAKSGSPPRASSYCDDDGWKAHASADLAELLRRAAKHEELLVWADEEDKAISQGLTAASTRASCQVLEQRLRRFHRRVTALEVAR